MLRTQPDSRSSATITQTGVSGRSSPQAAVTAAARRALPASSRRNPKTRRNQPEKVRTSIAPRLEEKVNRPECNGLSPTPTSKLGRFLQQLVHHDADDLVALLDGDAFTRRQLEADRPRECVSRGGATRVLLPVAVDV